MLAGKDLISTSDCADEQLLEVGIAESNAKHIHTNIQAEIERTGIVSSQLGYMFRDEHIIGGFDPGKFNEI